MARSQIIVMAIVVVLATSGIGYYIYRTVFITCCEPPVPELVDNQAPVNVSNANYNNSLNEVGNLADTVATEQEPAEITTKTFTTDELGESVLPMNFATTIPEAWQVKYIPGALAINFYDPAAAGASPLEQSQVFVKYFEASQFLTLQTVTIHAQEDLTINDRPTVRYDIEKKSGVANFANQPTWRSARHYVTDIRSSDASPTLFYVFGQNPDLDDETFFNVLESITFN